MSELLLFTLFLFVCLPDKAINNVYMSQSELLGLPMGGHLEISKTTVDVGDLLGELGHLFGHVLLRKEQGSLINERVML